MSDLPLVFLLFWIGNDLADASLSGEGGFAKSRFGNGFEDRTAGILGHFALPRNEYSLQAASQLVH